MIEHPYPTWFVWGVAVFVALHGLVHLLGAFAGFGWSDALELSAPVSGAQGAAWLIAAVAFVAGAAGYIAGRHDWWLPTALGIVISQPLVIVHWQDAWAGTVPNLILVIGCLLGFGAWQFENLVDRELDALRSGKIRSDATISGDRLDGLPAPVREWLNASGVVGTGRPSEVRLKQNGRMRTEPGGDWMSVRANQYVRLEHPSYVWVASVRAAPLVYLSGRDKYVDGEGHMLIKLLSLVPVADSTGPQIDQGSLVRYLAEIVWYPSAALEEYISWRAIDETTAEATMRYKGVQATATFEFTPGGEVRRITADRYYDRPDGATMEDWVVSIAPESYQRFSGVRVPTEAAVTWELDEEFTWYELTVTDLVVTR